MGMTERNKNAPTKAIGAPFAWLVQTTTKRNPPHGWEVRLLTGQQVRESVPVCLQSHADELIRSLNKVTAVGEMLAALVQGAKEEFVRVPYGASHEDVAAINEWRKMADETLAEWNNRA